MIKVGDYVRIKEEFKDKYFYSDELYCVTKINYNTVDFIGDATVTFDRPYPPDKDKQYTGLSISSIYIDVKYMRMLKLKQIFND